jgi:hypothetical protein
MSKIHCKLLMCLITPLQTTLCTKLIVHWVVRQILCYSFKAWCTDKNIEFSSLKNACVNYSSCLKLYDQQNFWLCHEQNTMQVINASKDSLANNITCTNLKVFCVPRQPLLIFLHCWMHWQEYQLFHFEKCLFKLLLLSKFLWPTKSLAASWAKYNASY